ncbi:hypothetical protein [Desulforegula conservatrix]|nr:hypothetical protein [Desulforegula conservatrix]
MKLFNITSFFSFIILTFLSVNAPQAAEKELVVVFTGDTAGYVEPCG